MKNSLEIKYSSEKRNIHPIMDIMEGMIRSLGVGMSTKKESIDEFSLSLRILKILCCNILFR